MFNKRIQNKDSFKNSPNDDPKIACENRNNEGKIWQILTLQKSKMRMKNKNYLKEIG